MSRRNRVGGFRGFFGRTNRKPSRGRAGKRLDLVSHAAAGAVPPVQPFEALESRMMLTIVQPAGQTYLAFEAEDPQATFTDLDSDGFQWTVVSGGATQGTNTIPSGGAAIQARRDPAGGATNDEGQVSYPIQLTSAGPYFFYARTKYTGSGGDNSMYLPDGRTAGPINADPTQQWDNRGDAIGNWHWNNLDVNGASFTYTNPTPGAETTLKMNIRENGYNVDRIVLSTTAMTPAQLDAITPQSVLAFTAPAPGQVTVSFTPVAGSTSYNILRGTALAGPFTQVGTAAGSATSFVDKTLPANAGGQTFYYTVQPVSASGPGPQVTPAAAVVVNQGARGTYYNELYWGGGGRSAAVYSPGSSTPVTTFRAGEFFDKQAVVPNIDFDWGNGSPDPAIRPDYFSTVFTGKVTIPTSADHPAGSDVDVTLINSSDDDGVIFVNGHDAANDIALGGHGQRDVPGTPITLKAGESYNFIVMQAEQGGGAGVRFRWINPATGVTEAVPSQYLTAAADVPAAPSNVSAGVVADPTGNQKMVTFTFTDNATSELRYELLRDGVLVGTAPMDNNGVDADGDATNGIQTTISDAQPLTGSHTYAIRAVNYDGSSALVAAPAPVVV